MKVQDFKELSFCLHFALKSSSFLHVFGTAVLAKRRKQIYEGNNHSLKSSILVSNVESTVNIHHPQNHIFLMSRIRFFLMQKKVCILEVVRIQHEVVILLEMAIEICCCYSVFQINIQRKPKSNPEMVVAGGSIQKSSCERGL